MFLLFDSAQSILEISFTLFQLGFEVALVLMCRLQFLLSPCRFVAFPIDLSLQYSKLFRLLIDLGLKSLHNDHLILFLLLSFLKFLARVFES